MTIIMKKTLNAAQAMFIAEGTPVTSAEVTSVNTESNATMSTTAPVTNENAMTETETVKTETVKRTWHTDTDYISTLPEDVQAAIKALDALPATLQTTFITSLDTTHKLTANYAKWLIAPKAHPAEIVSKARNEVTSLQPEFDAACAAIARIERDLEHARSTRHYVISKALAIIEGYNTPVYSTKLSVVTVNDKFDLHASATAKSGSVKTSKRSVTVKADGTERKARRAYVNSSTGQPLTVLDTILKIDWRGAMFALGKQDDGIMADVEIVNGEVTLTIVSSVGQNMGQFEAGKTYPLADVLRAWRLTGNTVKAYARIVKLDGTTIKPLYISANTKGVTGYVEEGIAIGATFPVPALTFENADAIDTWLGMES